MQNFLIKSLTEISIEYVDIIENAYCFKPNKLLTIVTDVI